MITFCPKELLLGSRLLPLKKNEKGDVRPLSCGELWYRIIGRAAVRERSYPCSPYQTGCGSKNGVEVVIEALRVKSSNRSIIGLDLKNAFNSLRRAYLLPEVKKLIPELWAMVRWSYEHHSKLYLSDGSILKSESGVKQGDPLSPLLFTIGYDRLLRKLIKELLDNGFQDPGNLLSYLDDTYLSCRATEVSRLEKLVMKVYDNEKALSGLTLRPEKTWRRSPQEIREAGGDLLGTHIGAKQPDFLQKFADDLQEQVLRLKKLRCQDAYLILRKSLVPKTNHLLRSLELPTTAWKQVDDIFVNFLEDLASKAASVQEINRSIGAILVKGNHVSSATSY